MGIDKDEKAEARWKEHEKGHVRADRRSDRAGTGAMAGV